MFSYTLKYLSVKLSTNELIHYIYFSTLCNFCKLLVYGSSCGMCGRTNIFKNI